MELGTRIRPSTVILLVHRKYRDEALVQGHVWSHIAQWMPCMRSRSRTRRQPAASPDLRQQETGRCGWIRPRRDFRIHTDRVILGATAASGAIENRTHSLVCYSDRMEDDFANRRFVACASLWRDTD